MFPQPPFPLEREPTASAPRGATLGTRIDKYRPLVMSLRFVRQLRNNTAQSLVLSVKLGAPFSRRRCGSCSVFEVAHTVYKYALNECSFIRLRQRRTYQADNLAELRRELLSVYELIAQILCAVSDCENKRGRWQSPLGFRFYLGDSHVALLL